MARLASASEEIVQEEAGRAGKTGSSQDVVVQSAKGLFSKQDGVRAKIKDKCIRAKAQVPEIQHDRGLAGILSTFPAGIQKSKGTEPENCSSSSCFQGSGLTG